MTLSPGTRKLALTLHVSASVGWMGAVAAFLALAVVGLRSTDPTTVRAAYVAMGTITPWVIVPAAVASLITGIVQSLGTPWGLFRHYWVVIKLVITIVATLVLVGQLTSIAELADIASDRVLTRGELREPRTSLVLHSGGGLAVLAVPMVLSMYKPRGLTRYGRRKRVEAGHRPDRPVSAVVSSASS
jgi:hypothetical protein